MNEILLEQLLKERELVLSLLNSFNFSTAKLRGIDLHSVVENNNRLIKIFLDKRRFEKTLEIRNKALDNMILDMYPEKSIKYLVNKDKNIFLN